MEIRNPVLSRRVALLAAFGLLLGSLFFFILNRGTRIEEPPPPADPAVLTLEDFAFLEEGLSLEEITARVGEPLEDVGSGLHIYIYPLADGRRVFLQFADLESLLGAGVMDAEGAVLQELVGMGE